jgi:hypothetical protein
LVTIGTIGRIGLIGTIGRISMIGSIDPDGSDMTLWPRTEFWHHRTRLAGFEDFETTGRFANCRDFI